MRGTEGSSLKKAGYLARKKTMHCKTSKLLKVQKHLYTYVKKKICPEFCFKMLFSMLMRGKGETREGKIIALKSSFCLALTVSFYEGGQDKG